MEFSIGFVYALKGIVAVELILSTFRKLAPYEYKSNFRLRYHAVVTCAYIANHNHGKDRLVRRRLEGIVATCSIGDLPPVDALIVVTTIVIHALHRDVTKLQDVETHM